MVRRSDRPSDLEFGFCFRRHKRQSSLARNRAEGRRVERRFDLACRKACMSRPGQRLSRHDTTIELSTCIFALACTLILAASVLSIIHLHPFLNQFLETRAHEGPLSKFCDPRVDLLHSTFQPTHPHPRRADTPQRRIFHASSNAKKGPAGSDSSRSTCSSNRTLRLDSLAVGRAHRASPHGASDHPNRLVCHSGVPRPYTTRSLRQSSRRVGDGGRPRGQGRHSEDFDGLRRCMGQRPRRVQAVRATFARQGRISRSVCFAGSRAGWNRLSGSIL